MSLQDLASFAEIVSALAVIISLLYLAKQVKTANDLNRTDAFRNIMYNMTTHLNRMFSVENVQLTIKGFREYTNLPAEEKLPFEHLMAGLFQHTEDSWNCIEAGILDAGLKENWAWFLKEKLFPYRGVRDWWTDYRPAYAPDLQDWIDSIEEDADHESDPYKIKDAD